MEKIHYVNGMEKNTDRVLFILDVLGLKTRRIIRDRDIYHDGWVYP